MPTSYQDWTLSKLGNWTAWDNDGANETRTHNNINALTARSTVANPLAYDTNFNLIDDGEKYTYEYDANDKLKIVRDRTTTAVVAEYRYDALGRRVEKEVDSDITRYYHSGEQIIEERDDSDAVVATYTYGTYIDEPLTMDRDSERFYYHTNRMYSVYALTDSSGDLVERYSYTPYGVTTTYDENYTNPQTTSRVGNPYTYTGQELDAETLLLYYNARTYNPTLGRFNQLDPIGFAGGDLNLYAYVGNRPTVFGDPAGARICTIPGPEIRVGVRTLAPAAPLLVPAAAKASAVAAPVAAPVAAGVAAGAVGFGTGYAIGTVTTGPIAGKAAEYYYTDYETIEKVRQRQVDCRAKHPHWPDCPDNAHYDLVGYANEFLRKRCPQTPTAYARDCEPLLGFIRPFQEHQRRMQDTCSTPKRIFDPITGMELPQWGGGTQWHCPAWCSAQSDLNGDPPARISIRACSCCRYDRHSKKSIESHFLEEPHWSRGACPGWCK